MGYDIYVPHSIVTHSFCIDLLSMFILISIYCKIVSLLRVEMVFIHDYKNKRKT